MKFRKLTSLFLTFGIIVLSALSGVSCSDTETTDSTAFAIYYSGVTDIGPSMNFNLNAPTYIGAAPSDFTITSITLDGAPFQGTSFVIEPATGVLSISDTAELPVGVYSISVSCVSNGRTYDFNDVIQINMMAPVPEGVKAEPNVVTIDFADVKTSNAGAQIVSEGEHVSITGYEVIQEEDKPYFAVSKTGKVTVNTKYNGEIPPGIYSVSLKITTGAGTGIFENAVEFNITSKPLELTYTPDNGIVETNEILTSTAPVVKGSLEELKYSIKAITPATDKIVIDETTGIISIAQGNNLEIGKTFVVDVTATNKYGSRDFDAAYSIEVVAFINPISNFSYADQNQIQATAFAIDYAAGFVGDMVSFEFTDLPTALNGQLALDAVTGKITAKKGNTIPVGSYTVKVKASNTKGESTAQFTLNVLENKNVFSYIRYGNNLSLPVAEHASQFRFFTESELHSANLTPSTDMKSGVSVEWSVATKYKMKGIVINPSTGELTFAGVAWREDSKGKMVLVPGGMVLVTATTGKGTSSEFSMTIPVFFHFAAPIEDANLVSTGVSVNYTPFVFKVNPRTGGKSAAPEITGVADMSKFLMDYRRTFNYYNIGANHKDGQPNANPRNGEFMYTVWDNYFKSLNNVSTNGGSKDPMSYYANLDGKQGRSLSLTAGYVDATDNLKVLIQPGKWRGDDNVYANGVMVGQMTFVTNGNASGINNGLGIFPLYIWFDENF